MDLICTECGKEHTFGTDLLRIRLEGINCEKCESNFRKMYKILDHTIDESDLKTYESVARSGKDFEFRTLMHTGWGAVSIYSLFLVVLFFLIWVDFFSIAWGFLFLLIGGCFLEMAQWTFIVNPWKRMRPLFALLFGVPIFFFLVDPESAKEIYLRLVMQNVSQETAVEQCNSLIEEKNHIYGIDLSTASPYHKVKDDKRIVTYEGSVLGAPIIRVCVTDRESVRLVSVLENSKYLD